MRFADIPQFPRACYSVDVGFSYVETHVASKISHGCDERFRLLPPG